LIRNLFVERDRRTAHSHGGYVALRLGIVFSMVVGCGLMALVFYSSRRGYDLPPHFDVPDERRNT